MKRALDGLPMSRALDGCVTGRASVVLTKFNKSLAEWKQKGMRLKYIVAQNVSVEFCVLTSVKLRDRTKGSSRELVPVSFLRSWWL